MYSFIFFSRVNCEAYYSPLNLAQVRRESFNIASSDVGVQAQERRVKRVMHAYSCLIEMADSQCNACFIINFAYRNRLYIIVPLQLMKQVLFVLFFKLLEGGSQGLYGIWR